MPHRPIVSMVNTIVLLITLSPVLAYSQEQAAPVLSFSDESFALRYDELIDELRCPKCQNQNLADSDAPIAIDLRKQLHTLLEEGRSNDEILDFMTLRYGDFVRYRPEFNANTAALWLLPVVALLVGLFFLWSRVNKTPALAVKHQNTGRDSGERTAREEETDSNELARRVEALKELARDD